MKKIDTVINELNNGKTISDALKTVTRKRRVNVPFNYEVMNVDILQFGFDTRTANALKRARFNTVADVLHYIEDGNSIREIKCFGRVCTIEFMEKVLDYAWEHMTNEERAEMLIETLGTN